MISLTRSKSRPQGWERVSRRCRGGSDAEVDVDVGVDAEQQVLEDDRARGLGGADGELE